MDQINQSGIGDMKPTVTGRTIKAKLATGARVVGGWITIPDPAVAEIMAQAGFDFLTVDMEHSPITLAGAAELIRVISLCEICPLVRLGANDPKIAVAGSGSVGVSSRMRAPACSSDAR